MEAYNDHRAVSDFGLEDKLDQEQEGSDLSWAVEAIEGTVVAAKSMGHKTRLGIPLFVYQAFFEHIKATTKYSSLTAIAKAIGTNKEVIARLNRGQSLGLRVDTIQKLLELV